MLNSPTASLQRGKTPSVSVLDMTLNNLIHEVPELWRMQSTPLLPSLPDSLRSGVLAPHRVLCMGQIKLICILMLNWIVWNGTVDMYKMDLALNTLQWLICHKTKLNFYKNSWWDKSLHIYPKALVERRTWLTYIEATILHFSHYTTGNSPAQRQFIY